MGTPAPSCGIFTNGIEAVMYKYVNGFVNDFFSLFSATSPERDVAC